MFEATLSFEAYWSYKITGKLFNSSACVMGVLVSNSRDSFFGLLLDMLESWRLTPFFARADQRLVILLDQGETSALMRLVDFSRESFLREKRNFCFFYIVLFE